MHDIDRENCVNYLPFGVANAVSSLCFWGVNNLDALTDGLLGAK